MSLAAYQQEKQQYRKYFADNTGRSGKEEEIRTTPLFSLKVKYAVDGEGVGPICNAAEKEAEEDHECSSSSESQSSSSQGSEAGAAENLVSGDSKGTVAKASGSESQSSGSTSSSSADVSSSSEAESVTDSTESTKILPQYGLLGHHIGSDETIGPEEPILLNVNAPNSAFICGSQGSGKSYTLSCMLENCLLANTGSSKVSRPVAGVVFHYDTNSTPTVAEAAYLCSKGVQINVFLSPCNMRKLGAAYEALGKQYGNVVVKPLLFRSSDLNTDRMNKLMCVAEGEGRIPLYLEAVQKILRDMAKAGTFSYANFIAYLNAMELTREQAAPMKQRLALLESFMNEKDIPKTTFAPKKGKASLQFAAPGTDRLFTMDPGSLTIIDLTDTFVDASTACILFDICLGLIQEQRPRSGLIITLDEAHRFLTKTSSAAETFTESLLTTIRTQRHIATRIIVATQEPTISEKLLDLCSMSIIHRFTSPAWFGAIKDHLCGASKMVQKGEERDEMFEMIVGLGVGESLVFAPSAFVGVDAESVKKLGARAMKLKTRKREGVDGGMSLLTEGA